MSEEKYFDLPILDTEYEKYKQFSSNNFLIINKKLFKIYDPNGAVFISNLIDKFLLFKRYGMLNEKGHFFHTHKKQTEETGLSITKIRTQKQIFIKHGVLFSEMKGSPAKEWYKINIERLNDILDGKAKIEDLENENNVQTSCFQTSKNLMVERSGNMTSQPSGNMIASNYTIDNKTRSIIINNNRGSFSNSSVFIQKKSRRKLDISQEAKESKLKTSSQKTYIKPENLSPEAYIKTGTWADCILKQWNKIPQVTKHRNKKTKTIQRIVTFINYIREGIIADHCEIKPEFLEKNNISKEMLFKKYTKREIINAINTFSVHFKNGYFPQNKNSLPYGLDSFIFDSYNNSSWFFKCVANPEPKLISEKRKHIDPNPQYTKPFQDRGLLKDFSEKDYPSIYQRIKRLENKIIEEKLFDFDQKNPRLWQKIGKGEGQLTPFFEGYSRFLKNEYNRIDNITDIFNPYSTYFKKYLEHIESENSSFKINF